VTAGNLVARCDAGYDLEAIRWKDLAI